MDAPAVEGLINTIKTITSVHKSSLVGYTPLLYNRKNDVATRDDHHLRHIWHVA